MKSVSAAVSAPSANSGELSPPLILPSSLYRSRRDALLSALHARYGGALVLMPTAPEVARNRDTYYPYRAESYFHYLSGFTEPEAVLALLFDAHGATRQILFCREKNPERETWDGFRYGPAAAREAFAFDEAFPIQALDDMLPALAMNQPVLATPLGLYERWDRDMSALMGRLRAQARAGNAPPAGIVDVRDPLDAMRVIKDTHEIALMRRAAEISAQAHRRVMQHTQPGHYEYQVEAELGYEFMSAGARAAAYPSIVASGANACTLHYVQNDRRIEAGDLLLIDAGCEYQYYAADITRTFPVGKRFSAAQKDVYEMVLAAQAACFDALRAGAPFHAYHVAAERVIAQGLIDFGLIKGPLDAALEEKRYQRFYMHRAGHWLGMDVHDAGRYQTGETSTLLVPGMVLTVEPGCYIAAADDVPAAFHNIGVRIEDDVLITGSGIDILTTKAPKTVEAIEALCCA